MVLRKWIDVSDCDEEEGMTEKDKCPRKHITVAADGKNKTTKKSAGQIWDQKKSLSYVKWASFYNNT